MSAGGLERACWTSLEGDLEGKTHPTRSETRARAEAAESADSESSFSAAALAALDAVSETAEPNLPALEATPASLQETLVAPSLSRDGREKAFFSIGNVLSLARALARGRLLRERYSALYRARSCFAVSVVAPLAVLEASSVEEISVSFASTAESMSVTCPRRLVSTFAPCRLGHNSSIEGLSRVSV